MRSIVLTGGGTIGHVAPHFAVTPHLNFEKVYYIGSSGIERDFVLKKGLPFYQINPVKLHRRITLKNLQIPFKFISSIIESKKILAELKPSVVFSKGGFVGLPVTIAANALKIPVIIHESDLSIGLSNKIASKFAKATLTTFEKTATTVKNGLAVGSPIREELFLKSKLDAMKEYKINPTLPVLLVTGGSSGARILNQTVLNSLGELTKRFFVFHVVGKGNLTSLKRKNYFEIEFADMALAYKLASVCLSRAGSNTAFELAYLKIPTLFVPLSKNSSRGDQIENARYFSSKKVASILYEEDLTANALTKKLFSLYDNKDYFIKNLNELSLTLANEKIAQILNKY